MGDLLGQELPPLPPKRSQNARPRSEKDCPASRTRRAQHEESACFGAITGLAAVVIERRGQLGLRAHYLSAKKPHTESTTSTKSTSQTAANLHRIGYEAPIPLKLASNDGTVNKCRRGMAELVSIHSKPVQSTALNEKAREMRI